MSEIPDLHFYRYDTPTGMCEHQNATVGRITLLHDAGVTSSGPVTMCPGCREVLEVHEASPDQEDE